MVKPMTVSITTIPTTAPIISVLIVIIVFILMVSNAILITYRFDCDINNGLIRIESEFGCTCDRNHGFTSEFGDPLSLLPTTAPQTIANNNENTRIDILYEFVIAILLSLISNINVYFTIFYILYVFCFELIILVMIVIFLLCAQTIASDSSARATFNDTFGIVSQFGLPTINISCGGILCAIAINNAINNYGYFYGNEFNIKHIQNFIIIIKNLQ